MALWVSRADSGALAELFDELAPGLLRVAIHLVGDSAQAEDLVQAAFLALIEQRSRIAEGTPAEPWLVRVIQNKSTDLRRGLGVARAASHTAIEELEGVGDAADISAERRELEGTVVAAIDELPSPYREVLIARLRHGATAAEIAHLFGRSPGQVRVQLHRGLELLRKKLPAREALAAFLLPLGIPSYETPSLGAIRESVLGVAAKAHFSAAAASLTAVTFTMLKATAGITAAVLLALAVYTTLGGRAPVSTPGSVAASPSDELALLGTGVELAVPGKAVPRAGVRPSEPSVELQSLSGSVIDAETELPIASALVRLVRRPLPRETWSELDLLQEFPELLWQQNDGSITPSTGGDWPTQEDVDARLIARPLDPENEEVAQAWTGADGSFRIEVAAMEWERTLLEFSAEGYAARVRPMPGVEVSSVVMAPLGLHRAYMLTGQVVVEDSGVSVERVFTLQVSSSKLKANPKLTPQGAYDKASVEALGAWAVTTDQAGRFDVQVVGDRPHVQVVTPGWSGGKNVSREEAKGPVTISASRTTRLLFVDEESGEPVERVSVLLSSRAVRQAYLSGRFLALGGTIEVDNPSYLARECPMDLLAWTPTHFAAPIRIDDFSEPRDITVRLEEGRPPKLSGRVVERGKSMSGLFVGLSPETSGLWQPERLRRPMVETQTGADGCFEFAAPQGTYVLRVETPSGEFADRVVSLPAEGPIEIDLAALGRIEIECLQHGAPPLGRAVAIADGPDGRRAHRPLDEFGKVVLAALPPGRYEVDALAVEPQQFTVPGAKRVVDLLPGQRVALSFDLTPPIAGRCRVAFADVRDFSQWRSSVGGLNRWAPMSAGGVLDASLLRERETIRVDDDSKHRFTFHASGQDLEGRRGEELVQLDRGGGVYSGVLTDEAGRPVSGIWVEARPTVDPGGNYWGTVTVASLTTKDGRFDLPGLEARAYEIRFRENDASRRWVPRWGAWVFRPTQLPQPVGGSSSLNIQLLAQPELTPVKGHVVDSLGAPVQAFVQGTARFSAEVTGANGSFSMTGKGSHMTSEADGTFELLLPAGVPCVVRAIPDRMKPEAYVEERIEVDVNSSKPLRFVLP